MTLAWRATFIDVEDRPSTERSCGGGRPRAASAPCARSSVDDLFAGEKAYVAKVADKYSRRPHYVETARASAEVQQLGVVRKTRPRLTNCALSSSLLLAKVEGKGMRERVPPADRQTKEPSSLVSDLTPSAAEGSASWTATNSGSLGHPQLCYRPCLYFETGRCVNGDACEFCHMPHGRRPVHLSKQHRELLHGMDASRAKPLLLSVVQVKARAVDASERTVFAVGRLAAACGVDEAARPHFSQAERSLRTAFHGMNLRMVLWTLQRVAKSHFADAAVEALLLLLQGNC